MASSRFALLSGFQAASVIPVVVEVIRPQRGDLAGRRQRGHLGSCGKVAGGHWGS